MADVGLWCGEITSNNESMDVDPESTKVLSPNLQEEAKSAPNTTMSNIKKRTAPNSKTKTSTNKVAKTTNQPEVHNTKLTSAINSPLVSDLLSAEANKALKYIKSDSGPYRAVVFLRDSDRAELSSKPPMDIKVSRFLTKHGVKFSLMERISKKNGPSHLTTEVMQTTLYRTNFFKVPGFQLTSLGSTYIKELL
ncbi:unnamed protein product [Lasius platythorax]|uniref:Uncharacterized protein n=1 Tax=Lasius platythorax TaxID=488582 RepID=A0AAV2NPZ4_9HYME